MLTLVNSSPASSTNNSFVPMSSCFLSTTNNPLFTSTTVTSTTTQRSTVFPASTITTETSTTNLKLTLKLSRKRQQQQQQQQADTLGIDNNHKNTTDATLIFDNSKSNIEDAGIENDHVSNSTSKRAKTSNFAQLQRDLFELYYRMTTTSHLLANTTGSSSSEEQRQLRTSVELMQRQYNELQKELELVRKLHEQQMPVAEEPECEEDNGDHEEEEDDDDGNSDSDGFRDSLDDSLADELSEMQDFRGNHSMNKNKKSNSNKRVRIMLECNQVFIVERLQYVYEDWNTKENYYHPEEQEGSSCITSPAVVEVEENEVNNEEELYDYYESSELFNL